MVETSVGGAVAGTGSAEGLAGGSGWSCEGVVVGGAVGVGGAGGMAVTSVGGVVAGTGSGWGEEGVFAGGTGGVIGEPDGSTGNTGCNCTGCIGDGVGVEEMSFVRE
jgi:hypothetical protein